MHAGVLHLSASIMMASWVRKVFGTYEAEQLATYTIDAREALLYVVGKSVPASCFDTALYNDMVLFACRHGASSVS